MVHVGQLGRTGLQHEHQLLVGALPDGDPLDVGPGSNESWGHEAVNAWLGQVTLLMAQLQPGRARWVDSPAGSGNGMLAAT